MQEMIKVITLTEVDLKNLLVEVNKIGRLEVEEEMKSKYDTPQDLTDLIEHHFPSYNTHHWITTLKKAIKAREVGRLDRFNKYMVSYNELSKYLFK